MSRRGLTRSSLRNCAAKGACEIQLTDTRDAERDMKKLPDGLLTRVNAKVISLLDDPYQRGTRKFSGHRGFRLRVGAHRVIYNVDDSSQTVTILSLKHRREACR